MYVKIGEILRPKLYCAGYDTAWVPLSVCLPASGPLLGHLRRLGKAESLFLTIFLVGIHLNLLFFLFQALIKCNFKSKLLEKA